MSDDPFASLPPAPSPAGGPPLEFPNSATRDDDSSLSSAGGSPSGSGGLLGRRSRDDFSDDDTFTSRSPMGNRELFGSGTGGGLSLFGPKDEIFRCMIWNEDLRESVCYSTFTPGVICIGQDCKKKHRDQMSLDPGMFRPMIKSPIKKYLVVAADGTNTKISATLALPVECFPSRGDTLDKFLGSEGLTWSQWEACFGAIKELQPLDGSTFNPSHNSILTMLEHAKRMSVPMLHQLPPNNPTKKARLESAKESGNQGLGTWRNRKWTKGRAQSEVREGMDVINYLSNLAKFSEENRVKLSAHVIHQIMLDPEAMHLQLSGIRRIIGDRSPFTRPEPVINQLEAIFDRVGELEQEVQDYNPHLMSEREDAVLRTALRKWNPDLSGLISHIGTAVHQRYEPMMNWYSKISSRGRLEKKILKVLKEHQGASGEIGMDQDTQGLIAELSSRVSQLEGRAFGGGTGGISIPGLAGRVHSLETQMTIVNNQRDRITLADHSFASEADAEAWLKIHANNSAGFLLFLDPHAFFAAACNALTIAQGTSNATASDLLNFEAMTKKGGYQTEEFAMVSQSFKISVPEVFTKGKRHQSGESKMLSNMPTYKDYFGGNVTDGLKRDIENHLNHKFQELMLGLQRYVKPSGVAAVSTVINGTKNFCDSLLRWISSLHEDMQKVSPKSEKDNWLYVCHAVRSIFEYLHEKRRLGHSPGTPERARLMWAMLKGYAASQEFLQSEGFTNHPAVQTTLNKHMQNKAVYREEYEAVINELKNQVKDLTARVSKAIKKN